MIHLLNLFAAIALLVWGTHIVRTGMLRVFGESLRRVLAASFSNRFKAAVAGIGVTSLVQSSTATCLIVASFENAMGTMERVHQASMEMSVDLMKELGVPIGPADAYKAKHGRMLHTVYSSICSVNAEFGEMVVVQVHNVSRFTRGITDALLGDSEQSDDDERPAAEA